MIEREVVRSRAQTVPSLMVTVLAGLKRALTRSKHRTVRILVWLRSTAIASGHAILVGPIKTLLFGRRSEVSVGTVLLAAVLAPAVAWWVATTSGYPPLERWVVGTWAGTDPSWIVFAGAAALVGMGTLSTTLNSGVVPTSLLVMAPLFGLASTRYGTRYTDPALGSQVVSLPEAIEFATAVAVVGGIPLAVVGFVLGALLRRGLRTLEVEALLAPIREDS